MTQRKNKPGREETPRRSKVERRRHGLEELRSRSSAWLSERELDEEAEDFAAQKAGASAPWAAVLGVDREPLETPLSFLPPEAKKVGFREVAERLAADPRGYALLTGLERGSAGLDEFRSARDLSWGVEGFPEAARSFSFCVNEVTYTAFECPSDDYRSSMRDLVARDGNWCETQFEPCALTPQFASYGSWDDSRSRWTPSDPEAGMAETLELCVPGSDRSALSVGTNRSDEWYPSFVGWHDPEALELARRLEIALSYDLDDQLPTPAPSKPRSRFGL